MILVSFAIRAGRCMFCQTPIAGHFEDKPGTWGSRRLPVRIASYAKRSWIVNIDNHLR